MQQTPVYANILALILAIYRYYQCHMFKCHDFLFSFISIVMRNTLYKFFMMKCFFVILTLIAATDNVLSNDLVDDVLNRLKAGIRLPSNFMSVYSSF